MHSVSILVLIVAVVACAPQSARRNLDNRMASRSLGEFAMMIYATTGRCWSHYAGYGKYCGPMGSGRPVDATDTCCRDHDVCYDNIAMLCPGAAAYLRRYQWTISNMTPSCVADQEPCGYVLCECDRVMAECLKRSPYNMNYAPSGVPVGPPVANPDPNNFLCFM
ncbi:neutral phospholipase A2 3-like isoform X2 [Paramacrobiotus metropolitanus]|uniref:neutral phospholipase A2 3-like isoform X2 n=1 Tax=Paramacrobiotus metropolitanus TaxID=2943436 RepID=UPI00244608A6|nr:neutral phospholipase A2 3-like isoform X2 [Paramacrobiotus metropolitanus]